MLGILFGLISILLAVPSLVLAIAAMLDPTSSGFAMIGAMLWATFGPHLVVAALVAFALAIFSVMRGARRMGRLALAVSGPALVLAGFIVAQFLAATASAGGSVNLASAFALGTMTEPAPDGVETIATVDGEILESVAAGRAGFVQVLTGAEGPAGSGENHGANQWLSRCTREGGLQLIGHRAVAAVQDVGPVERDSEDALGHVREDELVRHGLRI